MGTICVYAASVYIGPDICGQVFSFRPIPDCVYPPAGDGVEGRDVRFLHCTLYEINAPEGVDVTTFPDGQQAVPDPDKVTDVEVTLAASAVLDRARYLPGYEVVRIVWDYWGRPHDSRPRPLGSVLDPE
jgi:hypothetical protein